MNPPSNPASQQNPNNNFAVPQKFKGYELFNNKNDC